MSVEIGSTNLTDIQNPTIGPQLEEKLGGFTVADIMSELTDETDFSNFNDQGVSFEQDRAKTLSSTGADIEADVLSFDKDSYFLEMDGVRGREKFYVIEAREGLIVTSERDGAGFIGPDRSLKWSVEEKNFNDIEKILRGEFDLTERTHTVESDEEVIQVPSYSNILEESGDLPGEARESLLEIGDDEHLVYQEDEENGIGFWTDDDHGFKGRTEDEKVVVENFQELDYSINLDRIDPQNPHLDITESNEYDDIDFDLFTESILGMASEEEDGLVQDWDSDAEQNVLAYKKNSSDSEMTVLGVGDQNIEFGNGVKEHLEDVLSKGNHTTDLMARLGRILENPLRDDRFNDNELGYWKVADDLRLYTVTPEDENTTYLAFAGSHEEARKRFYATDNPNRIRDELMSEYVGEEVIRNAERYEAAYSNLTSILEDAGHSRQNAHQVSRFVETRLGDVDLSPSPTEFYNLESRYIDRQEESEEDWDSFMTEIDRYIDRKGDHRDYDQINIDIEGSIEDLERYNDDRLLSSLDPDSEYNEIHLDRDLSLNLRFREEDDTPSLDV